MSDSMKELIELLDEIFADPSYVDTSQMDGLHRYISTDADIVQHALDIIDEDIIVENGSVNYTNIAELNRCGYRVFPGELDGFGWLTGCIQKEKNGPVLVFG